MKRLCLLLFLLHGVVLTAYGQFVLEITVTNIQESKGDIYLGIYNKREGFPDEKKTFQNRIVSAEKGSVTISLSLPFGVYAVSVYHDVNRNGKLDKNVFGAPTEPYGFSNGLRPLFSAPDFEQCSFELFSDQRIFVSIK